MKYMYCFTYYSKEHFNPSHEHSNFVINCIYFKNSILNAVTILLFIYTTHITYQELLKKENV